MNRALFIIALAVALSLSAGCNKTSQETVAVATGWTTDFLDDFESFNTDNWQDQRIWVNDEHHCYVPDNQFNTRQVSDGTLKLRVVDLGEKHRIGNSVFRAPLPVCKRRSQATLEANGYLEARFCSKSWFLG